jgi:hypothetical protein
LLLVGASRSRWHLDAAAGREGEVNKPIKHRKDMNMKTNRMLNLLASALIAALAMSGDTVTDLRVGRTRGECKFNALLRSANAVGGKMP